MDVKCVRYEESGYPERLLTIPDPPKQLYYLGKLPDENRPTAAIIGARDCSEYGLCVTRQLGQVLGRNGIQVISGMARGIDGVGQTAALDAGGDSYAILGCGVDICYPKSNRRLYDRLPEKGGVISEYEPGSQALAGHFPPRNRIVSGLADVLIVVEAREKSGTLITVDMALEQGKEVYVVPGRITDRLSDGCNRLIKMGAGVLNKPEDFVSEVFGLEVQEERMNGLQLSPELSAVYRALDETPRSLAEIERSLQKKIDRGSLTTALIELCMESLAVQVSPGSFCRRNRR